MKKWVITIFLVLALAFAGVYVHVWLRLVPWLKGHSDLLSAISSVVQIGLWGIAGLAIIYRLWWPKKKPRPDPSEKTLDAPSVPVPVKPEPVVPANITIVQQAPASSSALHQLPPPSADFTGRTAELAELLEAVKKQGVAITGMHGMGGVGKTALALKIADQLKKDYPDAQIYLDLKGVEASPLLPRDAMAHVIRSFDLTAKLPESDAEVSALYRSVLHGKRALVLMDNAKDEQQVKPLIPPDGSLLIVTSRQHFVLRGLFDKNLDVLPMKDACDLLYRIAPRLKSETKDTIEELARLCGFLPRALETVANALRVKVNISPSDYAGKLKNARERLKLTEVDASLELSYQLLPEALRKQFCALAVFPDTFDGPAAAAVWEAEAATARDSLAELLLYSLLDFNPATERYRFHDLVRLFADGHLSLEERETAQRRHAGHYLQVLGTADDLYLKGGDSVVKGLALFDLEWSNIQAGQAWATAQADRDKTAAKSCSEYPVIGRNCILLRQPPRDRLGWLQTALDAAQRLEDRPQEGAILGNLGIAYYDLGEYRRAIECHEEHLRITRETGDRVGEGMGLTNLGLAHYSLGEYRRAIDYFEQRQKIALEMGNRRGEGVALGNLGVAYHSLGEYRRALEYHERRLKIAHEIGDRHGEGAALGNLGVAYFSLGEYQRAIEYHKQQLNIAREIGDREFQGIALWNSALAHDALKNRLAAITDGEAALKIYEEIESPYATGVREKLAKWRDEEKAKGKVVE